MRISKKYLDVFVLSGLLTSFFYGFLNPLYVSVILSRVDGRIIALGSFVSAAFPVLVGAAMGNPRVFRRLYAILPVVMVLELAASAASALVAAVNVMAYYLASMFVLGVFSTSVVYLLQKAKEVRCRTGRAAFDRRCAMADSVGSLGGSAVSVATVVALRDPLAVALLGVVQTLVVYGVFLLLYRKVPARKARRADLEGHPWGSAFASADRGSSDAPLAA